MSSNTIKLPISIVHAKGGYSVTMQLGANKQPVNLLLDTGSSTIAVESQFYDAEKDFYLQSTGLAQALTYGSGGWAGPVVNTHLYFETHDDKMFLKDAHIALIVTEQQDNFYGANGILGLGYKKLNRAYDLTEYFQTRNIEPEKSYPWNFEVEANKTGIRSFKKFLREHPKQYLTPFFTELEEQKISHNKFSFYIKRSIVHVAEENSSHAEQLKDPLNQGTFILGEGAVHREMYHGELEKIEVLHDIYYNTHLIAVQLGDGSRIKAPSLDRKKVKSLHSNSIIDTGTTWLVLSEFIYQEVLDQFEALDFNFLQHIVNYQDLYAQGKGYFPEQYDLPFDLTKWPDLHFYLQGLDSAEVKMSCTPDHYWQLNGMQKGRAWFLLMKEVKSRPKQSILGLPLISDYFCVFDRDYSQNGVIKVGEIED